MRHVEVQALTNLVLNRSFHVLPVVVLVQRCPQLLRLRKSVS
jgi:hypothetical protein